MTIRLVLFVKDGLFLFIGGIMIKIENLTKIYKGKSETVAIKNINLEIKDGEIFGIIGLSGAGKSTLIRCINMLEKPTSGNIYIDDVDITKLNNKELRKLRQNIGMIFQGFNLLEQRTVLQNVLFPLEIAKVNKNDAINKAKDLLTLVGLENKLNNYPSELSGGEKQRVAIARALTTNPKVLLSDEATSALDPKTTQNILNLLRKINKELVITIVLITHEMKIVDELCDRVAIINNSQIDEIGDVQDVFVSPKSEFTKTLLNTNTSIIDKTNVKKIRLIFDNLSTYEPIVSNLVLDLKVAINIIHADVNEENGIFTGSMLIEIPSDDELLEKVNNYLIKKKITHEEVE